MVRKEVFISNCMQDKIKMLKDGIQLNIYEPDGKIVK